MIFIKLLSSTGHRSPGRLRCAPFRCGRTALRNNSTKPKSKLTEENERLVEKLCKQQESIESQRLRSEVLVYEGQLTPSVRRIKMFSLTTTFLGLVAYPFLFKKASSQKKSALAHVFVGWTLIMVIFSPLALNYITKRYISELRFNRDTRTFRAITFNLFNLRTETQFKQADVLVPLVPGLFTSFQVRKKPMFMDPAYVQDIPAYQHMLGHDKPLTDRPPANRNQRFN